MNLTDQETAKPSDASLSRELADAQAIDVVLPIPPLPPRTSRYPDFDREYAAFLKLVPQLLATHRGKYIAVHGAEVVHVGDTALQVAMETYKKIGDRQIYVGLVSDEPPEIVRVPSARIVRWGPM